MAAMTPQASLVQRLSALLGFEDGVNDVLEHLLSIESSQVCFSKRIPLHLTLHKACFATHTYSHLTTACIPQDLTDYLSQLLGRNDKEVQSFVEDVSRFQRGEALSAPIGDEEDDAKPAAVPRKQTNEAKPKVDGEHTIFGHPATKTEISTNKKNTKATKAAAPPAKQPVSSQPNFTPKPSTPPEQSIPAISKEKAPLHGISVVPRPSGLPEQGIPATAKENAPQKSHPPKGKASIVCGCFGSLHKPLTNCLYCGRISCEREGYDFCPFCGILVERVSGGEGYALYTNTCHHRRFYSPLLTFISCVDRSKAWEHKERLLRFDRDFARRTVVLDDQADFFTSNKSWLTEEERIAAEEKHRDHKEKLRAREKQKLDIAF